MPCHKRHGLWGCVELTEGGKRVNHKAKHERSEIDSAAAQVPMISKFSLPTLNQLEPLRFQRLDYPIQVRLCVRIKCNPIVMVRIENERLGRRNADKIRAVPNRCHQQSVCLLRRLGRNSAVMGQFGARRTKRRQAHSIEHHLVNSDCCRLQSVESRKNSRKNLSRSPTSGNWTVC